MRVLVDSRRSGIVLIWTVSDQAHSLFVLRGSGRFLSVKRQLRFTDTNDPRINEDARKHWNLCMQEGDIEKLRMEELVRYVADLYTRPRKECAACVIDEHPRFTGALDGFVVNINLS